VGNSLSYLRYAVTFCPRGQLGSMFFTHLFPLQLPAELWLILSEDDPQDPPPPPKKEDKHWALHGATIGQVATVKSNAADPAQVATVSFWSSKEQCKDNSYAVATSHLFSYPYWRLVNKEGPQG
jgi:hypothetical protein